MSSEILDFDHSNFRPTRQPLPWVDITLGKSRVIEAAHTPLEEQLQPELQPQTEIEEMLVLPDGITKENMAHIARRRLRRVLFAGSIMLGSTAFAAEDYKSDVLTVEHHALHNALIAMDGWKTSVSDKLLGDSPKGPAAVAPKVSGPLENVAPTPVFAKSRFKNTDPEFAAEPSFLQNFTAMPNGSLDSSKWNYAIGTGLNGWGNQEDEYYTSNPTNIRVENGSLVIQANKQKYEGSDYTSARIDTEGKESFRFGKINIDAKMPAGESTWPAIWMLSANNTYVDLSPPSDAKRYLNSGEIDIAEEYGPAPSYVSSVAHHAGLSRNAGAVEVRNDTSAYNTYTLEWTPTKLIYLVNGKPFYEYSKPADATYVEWPFDQPFYLIINDAIRGNRVQGTKPGDVEYSPVDNKMFKADGAGPEMEIRYVAYYPYEGAKPTAAQLAQLTKKS